MQVTDYVSAVKSYAFTEVVRSQLSLQRLLQRRIKKKTPFTCIEYLCEIVMRIDKCC
jgi:hypothetical protein